MVDETCERCHKSDVGNMTQYTNHGLDKLLCEGCVAEIDEYYSLTCSICGKPAHMIYSTTF